MNERIRELAKEAVRTIEVKHEGYRGKGYTEQVEFFDKEKFAELIVRECLLVTKKQYNDTLPWGGVEDTIKEHFGVEE